MNLSYWKSSIPNISTDGLRILAEDTFQRIGSHVSGGNPVTEYIERQQALLELIQEELISRSNTGG
ncbi:hypothetical protein ACT8ZR_09095 [Neobacillus sp. M.A.Huq-85]